MNIKQMHIEVDLSLQKIASNVKRKFYPEEIDWIINKQIERFVDNAIKPKVKEREPEFQLDEINLESLRTLQVIDKKLPTTWAAGTKCKAELPGNFRYLVDSSSGVIALCGSNKFYKPTEINKRMVFIKPVVTTEEETPFYKNLELTVGATAVISGVNPSLPSKDMLFLLNDIIQGFALNHKGSNYDIYYERYRDTYEPNTFIFIIDTSMSATDIKLKYDAIVISGVDKGVVKVSVWQSPDTYRANRYIRGNRLAEFQNSNFAKSSKDSPIVQSADNTLYVYSDERFLVTDVLINYIRKPRIVNLSLGIDCDLPSTVHNKICDLTVEYIKMAIGDPNYQWKVQDNELRGK